MASKVLVVEDDRDIRRNLKRLLELEGYVVEVAENGKVALDSLNTAAVLPSVIILDLMMPVMDGFAFREEQRKVDRLAHIPVAIMTADGRIDEKKRLTKANAALKKPADVADILMVMEQFCGKAN
jgi:CheY-like chemotaxis protein